VVRSILIVDDNPSVRNVLRSAVELNTDWNVCGEAENGAMAVDKVREMNPDMVILDLSMPVMNGLEAARRIRKISPGVYIILFTMHASTQLSNEARHAGVNEVVSKLEDPSRILETLRDSRCA
jgi:two-component system, chemotaxis family, chemotaxis protein CheY